MVLVGKQLKHSIRNRNPAFIEVLDPQKLFEIKYQNNVTMATGVAWFAYTVIPKSLLRSLCLALDPTTKFVAHSQKITTPNRTRYRTGHDVFSNRIYSSYANISTRTRTYSVMCETGGDVESVFNGSLGTSVLEAQTPIQAYTKDTTKSTRPFGSDYGEYIHFMYSIDSPPRSLSYIADVDEYAYPLCLTKPNFTFGRRKYTYNVSRAAIMRYYEIPWFRDQEIATLQTLMSQQVLKLLPKAVPTSRRYSLARNLAELKDLPRSVISLQHALSDFSRLTAHIPSSAKDLIYNLSSNVKNVPGEYVSYWFGWRQLYKDVVELLDFPEKATKDVNRLIERNGKPTSFRVSSRMPGTQTATPTFRYDPSNIGNESSVVEQTTVTRDHEFRLLVNATFDFPTTGIPELRRDLFLQKLGVKPTPTDLYNLIPWSWLLDWFTGLGNYIECIDVINTDQSLFNFGFLTGVTTGKITTYHSGKSVSTWSRHTTGIPADIQTTTNSLTHQSVLDYKVIVRKNITTAYNVKTILEPSTLSTYQNSILGAILLARRK